MNAALELPVADVPDIAERQAEGWALLSGPLAKLYSPVPPPEMLIEWNASLAGAAKIVLTADRVEVLRAELPVDEDHGTPDAGLAGATAAGFATGWGLWAGSAASPGIVAMPAPLAASGSLMEVCAASGWKITRRDSGELTTDLGSPDGPSLGRVLPQAAGVLLFVELAALAGASAASRAAIARCLLLAGGVIRWARPVVRAEAERATAGFEILLPPEPSPSLLADALCALAVCSKEFGQEVTELLHETTARDFLEVTEL